MPLNEAQKLLKKILTDKYGVEYKPLFSLYSDKNMFARQISTEDVQTVEQVEKILAWVDTL